MFIMFAYFSQVEAELTPNFFLIDSYKYLVRAVTFSKLLVQTTILPLFNLVYSSWRKLEPFRLNDLFFIPDII
jgi:hypothetical protein